MASANVDGRVRRSSTEVLCRGTLMLDGPDLCQPSSMSASNLDLVRSVYADWDRGDYRSVAWAHPEIEFAFVDFFGLGDGRGVAKMAEVWFEFLRTWEEFHNEARDYRELDAE